MKGLWSNVVRGMARGKMTWVPLVFYALTAGSIVFAAEAARSFDHTHTSYEGVLKRVVKDAFVDYAALKSDSSDLDRYLDTLAGVTEAHFKQWSREEQIAYLVNLYNAETLRLILNHYPLKSIKDIGSVLKGPWDQPVVRLFGETTTLNTIEHKILRKKYDEPRVHFALVCAARGCPPLRSEAYRADRLEEQFKDQGRMFLATAQKNSVDPARKEVSLSPIFKWFAGDFEKRAGSVLAFVKPYLPPDAASDLTEGGYKIRYTYYDWSLNDQQPDK